MTTSTINLKELTVPAGVTMTEKKTAIIFIRGEKKAVLKGKALEVTNVIKDIKRITAYSAEIIEKCHLGSIRGVIAGVKDTADLQAILTKYYKQSGSKKAKPAA
jgi:N-acetylneuraminic acid mutarotase